MPIVIDANCANSLASATCEPSKAIIAWVRKGGIVESGGRLQQELKQTRLKDLLMQWSAAGRLVILSADHVLREERKISKTCQSDDPHVLAVTKLGSSMVVISGDKDLQLDLKKGIIGKRCKIINCNQGVFSSVKIVRSLLSKHA